jgi:hypothetical protein
MQYHITCSAFDYIQERESVARCDLDEYIQRLQVASWLTQSSSQSRSFAYHRTALPAPSFLAPQGLRVNLLNIPIQFLAAMLQGLLLPSASCNPSHAEASLDKLSFQCPRTCRTMYVTVDANCLKIYTFPQASPAECKIRCILRTRRQDVLEDSLTKIHVHCKPGSSESRALPGHTKRLRSSIEKNGSIVFLSPTYLISQVLSQECLLKTVCPLEP